MKDFRKRILLWLIGVAVFVVSVDVIVWLFERFVFSKDYEFTVKWGITVPLVLYFILTFGYWCTKKFKKKRPQG